MASYNKVLLMGNLTRDPELRYTPSQTPVANFSIAVNRRWRDQNGEQREEVTYVDCESYARQAEVINQYLKKGSPVFIEGRLKLDQWQDKNTGDKRSRMKVVVEAFQFIDAKGSGQGGGGQGGHGGGQGGHGGHGGGSHGGDEYGEEQAAPPPRSSGGPPRRSAPSAPPPGPNIESDDIPF